MNISGSLSFFLLVSVVVVLVLLTPLPVFSKPTDSHSLEILENLQGCQKGQSVKGVQQLKQYLKKFGYLTYQKHDAHANDEEFDDALESAVKTYQLNYNLNVTGTIDPRTLENILAPRCGVPDIINGFTRMQSEGGNNKQNMRHRDRKTLHTVSHFSFFPNRPTWPPNETALKYTFSSSSRTAIDISTLSLVMSKAFASWAAWTHFTFEETNDLSNADLVIGFHSGDHGDNYPFDGFRHVLAHAFAPTDGRLHFDADENWGTNPSPSIMDLQSVAVHEVGHLLGLGHSSDEDAVMYPTITYGETKRDLAEDDIEGIQTLFFASGIPIDSCFCL